MLTEYMICDFVLFLYQTKSMSCASCHWWGSQRCLALWHSRDNSPLECFVLPDARIPLAVHTYSARSHFLQESLLWVIDFNSSRTCINLNLPLPQGSPLTVVSAQLAHYWCLIGAFGPEVGMVPQAPVWELWPVSLAAASSSFSHTCPVSPALWENLQDTPIVKPVKFLEPFGNLDDWFVLWSNSLEWSQKLIE